VGDSLSPVQTTPSGCKECSESGTLEVRFTETVQFIHPSVIFLHFSGPRVEDSIVLQPVTQFEVFPDEGGNSARILLDPVR
jgi:hypothetical protein